MWRVSIHAPKDSFLDESFFAAKVVFYCWPYAPSLIHVVSASAARRWRVERGEYSGTGPAIPPPLTRCADCCFGELRIARGSMRRQIQLRSILMQVRFNRIGTHFSCAARRAVRGAQLRRSLSLFSGLSQTKHGEYHRNKHSARCAGRARRSWWWRRRRSIGWYLTHHSIDRYIARQNGHRH